jgi:hypothetical protein
LTIKKQDEKSNLSDLKRKRASKHRRMFRKTWNLKDEMNKLVDKRATLKICRKIHLKRQYRIRKNRTMKNYRRGAERVTTDAKDQAMKNSSSFRKMQNMKQQSKTCNPQCSK